MSKIQTKILVAAMVAASAAMTVGCVKKGEESQHEDAPLGEFSPVKVERFDSLVAIYGQSSASGRDSLSAQFAPVIDLMSRMNSGREADDVIADIAATRYFEVFFPDVAARLGSLDALEAELGSLRELLPAQADSVRFPSRVFGIVTPYDQSVMLSDSIMLIGLNHYLGADYAGYEGFDDYRRRLKTLSRTPIDVAEALVYTAYPFDGSSSSTALQRMVYEGAVVAAVSRALPRRQLSEIMGYTPEQMQWLEQHESEIWRKMVADQMLYTHDRSIAERLVLPAPFTSVISPDAPGRAGRFIGYRIAESYLRNNPQSKPSDLLGGPTLTGDDLLVRAGYRK